MGFGAAQGGGGGGSVSDGSVTLAKLADLATDKLIGRTTASTGVPEAVTFTDFGQSLLAAADAAAARTLLEIAQASLINDVNNSAVDTTYGAEETAVVSSNRTTTNLILTALKNAKIVAAA